MKKIIQSLWCKIKEKWWYLILITGSTVYIFRNKDVVMSLQFDKLTSVHVFFVFWIILLIIPLFSEMELFGIKLTKEVQKVKEDVKDDLNDLKLQIMQLHVSNSVANNIHVGNAMMPSEEKIEELLKLVHDLKKNQTTFLDDKEIDNTDKSVYLFKVRLSIETAIAQLMETMGYDNKMPLFKSIQMLYKLEVLDAVTFDLLSQVLKIANRGVHGEIVSDEYIDFVKEAFPQIRWSLKQISNDLYYIVCPKCNYSGYSKFENVCPRCGNVNVCD